MAKKKSQVKNKKQGRRKRALKIVLLTFIAGILTTASVYGISRYMFHTPYAVCLGDNKVCYVGSKHAAEKTVSEILNKCTVEGTKLKVVKNDGTLSILRSEDGVPEDEILSADEAADAYILALKESNDEDNPPELTIVSTRYENHKITLKTKYIKDESMLAGQSEIRTEGKKEKRKLLVTYTTVNGETADVDEKIEKVLKKGTREVIAKGTLGLPDGADWKTYDGQPVFNDGADLVVTGQQYIGKVPYKWGGRNLATGVSCLGLVKELYAKYGIYLPMSHPGMKKSGIGVSYGNAQKGDIICYKAHVGIYVGNGKMLDATHGSGVSVRSVNPKKIVTVRRIIRN